MKPSRATASTTGWRLTTPYGVVLFDDELSPAPAETWWDIYGENRDLPMAQQLRNWTCSICACDWLLRATGLDPYSTREKVAGEIGYPGCVDEFSGLRDTQCLVRVLEQYGVRAEVEWVGWMRAMEIAQSTAFIADSIGAYHFMGGRGVTGDGSLWLANSAPNYMSIGESVSRLRFLDLTPWKFVYLVR